MALHIFARSAFSWESSAWAGIALKCVVNSASGQQSQTELRLYFGVCVLQKFQQSSHGDGRFAFGVYSLWAGCSGFRIEAFFKLFPKLHTRGLLDMGVGVHQHIRRTQIKNNVDRTNNSCKFTVWIRTSTGRTGCTHFICEKMRFYGQGDGMLLHQSTQRGSFGAFGLVPEYTGNFAGRMKKQQNCNGKRKMSSRAADLQQLLFIKKTLSLPDEIRG